MAQSVSRYQPVAAGVADKVNWLIRDLNPDTPPEELASGLQALIPVLARAGNLEFEGLLSALKAKLGLTNRLVKGLRDDIKEAKKHRKESLASEGSGQSLSPEEELQELKTLSEPLAECNDILTLVGKVLHRRGVAGQDREAKILYLAVTSRISERPVNAVVKGPSSGGKSFLVEKVLDLFPPSAVYALSDMSEKALAYSQEPLAHRFLVIYEAAGLGGDFAQYLMRSLLSEGRVRYETVEKTKSGLTPRLIEREGPTGLIITTTEAGLHPENETRMISLEVDDTPEQTKAVLLAHAGGEERQEVDLAPFVAFQKILEIEGPQVVVPFATAIAEGCDPSAVRLRRDFPSVLTLVKAHALLHAQHRNRDDHGRVVATLNDYRAVYDLIADRVAQNTGHAVAEKVQETVAAVAFLQTDNPSKDGFTYQQLAHHLGLDKSAARRRVKVGIEKGYLVNQETRKGLPARITLGDPLPAQRSVLPEPTAINPTPPETVATVPPQGVFLVKPSSSPWQDQKPPSCHPDTTKDFRQWWQVAKGKKMAATTVNPSYLFIKNWMVARWHESARKAH